MEKEIFKGGKSSMSFTFGGGNATVTLGGGGVSFPMADIDIFAPEAAGGTPPLSERQKIRTQAQLELRRKAVTGEFKEGEQGGEGSPYFTGSGAGAAAQPKEEDYIYVPFRALTNTIVAAGTWRATEFPKDVLKASVSKLQGKPAYDEHWMSTWNSIGTIPVATWADEGVNGEIDGKPVPAGINVIFKIDAVNNYELARRVLGGEVFSCSVTVVFSWIPSHPYEEETDFKRDLGKIKDGRMVCRVASEIIEYYEVSTVALGADPFAKFINLDGTLRQIDKRAVANLSADYQRHFEKFTAVYKPDTETQPDSEGGGMVDKFGIGFAANADVMKYAAKRDYKPFIVEDETEDFEMSKELKEALAKVLGVTPDTEITAAMVADGIVKKQPDTETKLTRLTALTALTGYSEAAAADTHRFVLNSDFLTLEKAAGLWANERKAKVADIVEVYRKSTDTPSVVFEGLILAADDEQLAAFEAEFTKKAAKRFGMKCNGCGSTEYTFKSSITGNEGDTAGGEENTTADGNYNVLPPLQAINNLPNRNKNR